MKKLFKSKTFLGAILSIALCTSLIAGATFAIFTSDANVNISVTSGKVNITATVQNEKLHSYESVDMKTLTGNKVERTMEQGFLTGGTASYADNTFTLDRIVPGDGISFNIVIDNQSNIDIQYRVVISATGGSDLMSALKVKIDEVDYMGAINGEWKKVVANGEIAPIPVEIELPLTADNNWQDKKISFEVKVEAVQGNANTEDKPLIFTEDTEYYLAGIRANGVDGVLQVNSGTLTINGNGELLAKGGMFGKAEYAMAVWVCGDNAKAVINGGHYTQTVNKPEGANTKQYDLIYTSKGVIEIYGGIFESVTPDWTLNCSDAAYKNGTANIIVMGGKYLNFNPADCKTEGEHTNFVPAGYKVNAIPDGENVWYEVVREENTTTVVPGKGAYEDLSTAIDKGFTETENGKDVEIKLVAGKDVTLDNGIANEGDKARNVTIKGDGSQTVDVAKNAPQAEGAKHLNYQRGSTFTFENLTIENGTDTYDGIVCDELIYKNCVIKGVTTLYGKATFINCTFENTMENQYSIWTWGGTDVTFENCTFNTNGKAILLYGQATAAKPTNLVVKNCTFNDRNNGAAGKAAIEIGNDYNATYTLTVNNATVNGFADGKNTGSKLWANKNSMDAAHLTVTIDGTKVQ